MVRNLFNIGFYSVPSWIIRSGADIVWGKPWTMICLSNWRQKAPIPYLLSSLHKKLKWTYRMKKKNVHWFRFSTLKCTLYGSSVRIFKLILLIGSRIFFWAFQRSANEFSFSVVPKETKLNLENEKIIHWIIRNISLHCYYFTN